MRRQRLSIWVMLAGLQVLNAQMPNTDLWLFKLESNKQKQVTLKDPLNITDRPGYDNQPSFSNDDTKIYYVSVREENQADIYYYDIKDKKSIQHTKSKESEYSPVETQDGRYIASVVVEKDSTQRIHLINTQLGFDEKKLEPDSVGYYTFLNKDTVIYYKLTEPHSLRYHIKNSGEDRQLCQSPVRTFRAVNRHTVLYGIKDSAKVTFYKYDFMLQRAYKYTEYPSLNEDVIWHSQMGLMKSEESKLFRYDELKKGWVLFQDLAPFGIKKITRFAFDSKNKYLVVVNNP